jgi:thymidylate synthase
MKEYIELVAHVITNGTRKENRTGVDTLSTFGYYYEHDMQQGFPLLTTKKISWKNIVLENLWFLSGSQDISFLRRHGCRFWDPWADEHGNVPSAYGNFWRHFPVHTKHQVVRGSDLVDTIDMVPSYNDQIRWVLDEMRRNPMSRRMVVSAWAPGNAQTSTLPPCHCLFAFNVQNYTDGTRNLCLHLTQRSCDVALGVPYNIAGYAFLLQLFSHMTGIAIGKFGHTLIDAHIYISKPNGSQDEYDHRPNLIAQCYRNPRPLPRLKIASWIKDLGDIESLLDPKLSTDEIMSHFVLDGYDPHPELRFKVAV